MRGPDTGTSSGTDISFGHDADAADFRHAVSNSQAGRDSSEYAVSLIYRRGRRQLNTDGHVERAAAETATYGNYYY